MRPSSRQHPAVSARTASRPYDAAASRQQKQRQQELLGKMEQLADTLCEQFLHMAQDVAVRGGSAGGGLEQQARQQHFGTDSATPTGAPPLTAIRQYVEQMQFDFVQQQQQRHHVDAPSQKRASPNHVGGGARNEPYDFARRLSIGETTTATTTAAGGGVATTVPTMSRHPSHGLGSDGQNVFPHGTNSFLPPVLQSQRLMGSHHNTQPQDPSTIIKGLANAAPVHFSETDLGVFDDSAGGRLRVAQQAKAKASSRHPTTSPRGNSIGKSLIGTAGISPRHKPLTEATGTAILWKSEYQQHTRKSDGLERFDPDEVDGVELLHVPNYNAVRTMLSDDHGLKVGHIQPLLGAMHGQSFGLLDCMLDGNTRQLSARRPPQLTEVERRLRTVPEVAIGPSVASALNTDPQHVALVSKLTPRFQRQRDKERAVAIAAIMSHEDRRQHVKNPTAVHAIPLAPSLGGTAHRQWDQHDHDRIASERDDDDATSEVLLLKPSPRDVVAQLAASRRRF